MKFRIEELNATVTIGNPVARTICKLSKPLRRAYAHDMACLMLNGLNPDLGVTVTLPRGDDRRFETEGDKAGVTRERADSSLAPASPEPRPAADSAPADPEHGEGEWPKYLMATSGGLAIHSSNANSRWFPDNGAAPYPSKHPYSGRTGDGEYALAYIPITPTEAAEWLRAKGHPEEAARIEGKRFEPVGTMPVVGDRVVDLRRPDVVLAVDRIDGRSVIRSDGYVVGFGVFFDRPECHEHRILKRPSKAAMPDGMRVFRDTINRGYQCVCLPDGRSWYRYTTPPAEDWSQRTSSIEAVVNGLNNIEIHGPEAREVWESFVASGVQHGE